MIEKNVAQTSLFCSASKTRWIACSSSKKTMSAVAGRSFLSDRGLDCGGGLRSSAQLRRDLVGVGRQQRDDGLLVRRQRHP